MRFFGNLYIIWGCRIQYSIQFAFQHLCRFELIHLCVPDSSIDQRVLRNQANQFAMADRNPITLGFTANGLDNQG